MLYVMCRFNSSIVTIHWSLEILMAEDLVDTGHWVFIYWSNIGEWESWWLNVYILFKHWWLRILVTECLYIHQTSVTEDPGSLVLIYWSNIDDWGSWSLSVYIGQTSVSEDPGHWVFILVKHWWPRILVTECLYWSNIGDLWSW